MKRFKKARISFLFAPLIFILLLIPTFSYGAGDPGVPDTVRFESWGTYIPCPPCTGHGVIPVVAFNDEVLSGFWIPLELTGPATYLETEFTGRACSLKLVTANTFGVPNEFILAGANDGDLDYTMPAGNGIIAFIHVSLNDTGWANLKEYHVPTGIPHLAFFDPGGWRFRPMFLESEHHIVPQAILPGDLNESGDVSIVDVVFLINYLFRNGSAPLYPPCADPNIDCLVTISDAVYLVNYVFKNGSEPQLGCAF